MCTAFPVHVCCHWPLHAQAYLGVGPHVAGFPEYLEPLAWHLLRSKLRHWEKGLRELAAQALAGGQREGQRRTLWNARLGASIAAVQGQGGAEPVPSPCIHVPTSPECAPDALKPPWAVHCARPTLFTKQTPRGASPSPAALAPLRPGFFLDQALPFLLPLTTDPVMEARHGAVAALAELLPALRRER